jgi:hypothetical protein
MTPDYMNKPTDIDEGRFMETLSPEAEKLLTCLKCGANRTREPCSQPSDCGMIATAHNDGSVDFVKFDMTKHVPIIYTNRT